jgi:hypothetical protein
MQPFRNVRHRFTTAEYGQLLQSGAFAPDARVELIRGEIMDIAPRESDTRARSRRCTNVSPAWFNRTVRFAAGCRWCWTSDRSRNRIWRS